MNSSVNIRSKKDVECDLRGFMAVFDKLKITLRLVVRKCRRKFIYVY